MKLNHLWLVFLLTLVSSAGAADAAKASCPVSMPLPTSVRQAQVILIGEQHVTREMPKWFEALACALMSSGARLNIGLEIPASEQPRIDRYLRSAGSGGDVKSLLDSPFWQRPDAQQDGRESIAMFELIKWAPAWKMLGHPASQSISRTMRQSDPATTGSSTSVASRRHCPPKR